MNLYHLLQTRRAAGRPVRVALIGAGKFGSMFLSQVPHVDGLEVPLVVDLDPGRAKDACRTVGWDDARIAATTFTADAAKAASADIEVVVEATGNPAAGISHARAAIAAGKHIVMVNVEADVLAGPLLAEQARRAGVVYSLAYGDQPALTAEMVDWARSRKPGDAVFGSAPGNGSLSHFVGLSISLATGVPMQHRQQHRKAIAFQAHAQAPGARAAGVHQRLHFHEHWPRAFQGDQHA